MNAERGTVEKKAGGLLTELSSLTCCTGLCGYMSGLGLELRHRGMLIRQLRARCESSVIGHEEGREERGSWQSVEAELLPHSAVNGRWSAEWR
jgi:hypothetical protein